MEQKQQDKKHLNREKDHSFKNKGWTARKTILQRKRTGQINKIYPLS